MSDVYKFVDINGNEIEEKLHCIPDKHGLMCPTDKTKLASIEEGANKTIVDEALDSSSTNPVQNAIVTTALGEKAESLVAEYGIGNAGITWTSERDVINTVYYSKSKNIWLKNRNDTMYYSEDGKNWTFIGYNFNNYPNFYEGNNIIFNSGSSGVWYSTDGKTWNRTNLNEDTYFECSVRKIQYNNGIFVATNMASSSNYGAGLYYSTDGKTWTRSNITSGDFNNIYYANGIWVAGSYDGYGLWYSEDGKTWMLSNKISGNFRNVYYGNNIWIAAFELDGLYYSTDGKEWTQSNITSGYFYCIYYGNNIWVACSDSNKGLYYSEDGMTWTQSNITSGSFYSVYYGNNIWIAGSSEDDVNGLYYSEDGITWTQSNITSGYFYKSDLIYNNHIWILISNENDGVWYSTDGKTWTQSNITSGNIASIDYSDDQNLWLAIDTDNMYVYTSEGAYTLNKTSEELTQAYNDGKLLYCKVDSNILPLTTVDTENDPRFIFSGTTDTEVISVSVNSDDSVILSSIKLNEITIDDTLNDSSINPVQNKIITKALENNTPYSFPAHIDFVQSNITEGDFTYIYFANGIWVAGSNYYGLYYSTDGKTWTQSNITYINFEYSTNSIYYANNIWVAGGDEGIYYSIDGKEWIQSNITNGYFGTIYYDNGIWVAGIDNGDEGIYYSTDGMTWVQSNFNNIIDSSDYRIFDIYYGNNIWVAGSNFGLYYSEDGMTWTQSNITDYENNIHCVYYSNNIWVAGSNYGLFYSEDGKIWTQSDIIDINFGSIRYANGMWIAGGNSGLFYSEDGKIWTQSSDFDANINYYNTIYYENGIWFANRTNCLVYSTDGKSWGSLFNTDIRAVHYANNTLIAVGQGIFNIEIIIDGDINDLTNEIYSGRSVNCNLDVADNTFIIPFIGRTRDIIGEEHYLFSNIVGNYLLNISINNIETTINSNRIYNLDSENISLDNSSSSDNSAPAVQFIIWEDTSSGGNNS